jgi:hypothetical protein
MTSNSLAKQLGIKSNLASQASPRVNVCAATPVAINISFPLGGRVKKEITNK